MCCDLPEKKEDGWVGVQPAYSIPSNCSSEQTTNKQNRIGIFQRVSASHCMLIPLSTRRISNCLEFCLCHHEKAQNYPWTISCIFYSFFCKSGDCHVFFGQIRITKCSKQMVFRVKPKNTTQSIGSAALICLL